jgi:hypothetical protein
MPLSEAPTTAKHDARKWLISAWCCNLVNALFVHAGHLFRYE